jgi:hypothetical protein
VTDKELLDNLQKTEDTLIEIRNFLISLKSQCDFLYLISENISKNIEKDIEGMLLKISKLADEIRYQKCEIKQKFSVNEKK